MYLRFLVELLSIFYTAFIQTVFAPYINNKTAKQYVGTREEM